MEPGPVVLVTTRDGGKNNIMTISWTMVVDFTPLFAMTTGPWNHSYAALRKTRECVIAIPDGRPHRPGRGDRDLFGSRHRQVQEVRPDSREGKAWSGRP